MHPIYSNTVGTFFKPLTPYKPGGMVDLKDASEDKIIDELPQLLLSRQETIDFEATLAKIEARQHTQRRVGQNTLMGTSN